MKSLLSSALSLALLVVGPATSQTLDYSHQDEWQVTHGAAQSPIDIVSGEAIQGDALEAQAIDFRHSRTKLEVVDNGHAIEAEVDGPDAIIRGRHFKLAQFHFHAESEHTVDGRHFPLEGHFVFKANDGRLAVVAVMYREGAANPVAGQLLSALAKGDGGELPATEISTLLPKDRGYFHYLGSLTTPPLTENVEWYVLEAPMTMSAEQIAGFTARYDHNNRIVQPRNGRPVTHFRS